MASKEGGKPPADDLSPIQQDLKEFLTQHGLERYGWQLQRVGITSEEDLLGLYSMNQTFEENLQNALKIFREEFGNKEGIGMEMRARKLLDKVCMYAGVERTTAHTSFMANQSKLTTASTSVLVPEADESLVA